ncbi:hypothetical protein BLL52_2166 [Rhodoferax antarcticus ANT.BR]|uniref:Uncharacterized protein n=1 Tax=Rhodoferax antarcticus ANT.BR TaxID=1111071 RepID=A0A1Q8YD33_9BURK|nr:hypothetical protein BLL52_2166 [Rhodoferax antarcticus ANT.BR]
MFTKIAAFGNVKYKVALFWISVDTHWPGKGEAAEPDWTVANPSPPD